MQYLISFLEGIYTFISPCLLPMLPIYISYFAGSGGDKKSTLKNALGFVLGFTIVFTAMGAFAGTIGYFIKQYSTVVNIITGGLVVLFGLNFLGVLRFNLFSGRNSISLNKTSPFFSVLFGMAFSIGWTPCVGAFLGSALMLASSQGSVGQGVFMLLIYSLGLGIPFIISAVLIDRLKSTFDFIKKHYRIINTISGVFLIAMGVLMMSGLFGYWLSLISF